jgi:hypothetical protein
VRNTTHSETGIDLSNILSLSVSGNTGTSQGPDFQITRANTGGGAGFGANLQFSDNQTRSYNMIQSSVYGLQFMNYYGSGPWTERMRVIPNGNVGIGTPSPSAKLHVVGIGSNLNVGNSDVISGDLVVQANTGSRNISKGAALEFVIPANTDGSNLWGQGRIMTVAGDANSGSAGGKMVLGTRRYWQKPGTSGMAWNYGDDIAIDEAGYVGIGTTSPDAKLAVKGQVHAQEVKVDLNGAVAPDYVFEKDYKLTSLEEIKNYIDQNKHLPEVPSAKEMEKNGVQLGEMNMLLLKKIEELTLYQIEANRKIEILQREIQNLKNKS